MFQFVTFMKRFCFMGIFLTIYLIVCLQYTSQNSTPIDEQYVIVNPSVSSYQMENTSFFPHLPIEIHTKNREKLFQLKTRTKKLILLANKFFNDSTWSIKSLQTTSSTNNCKFSQPGRVTPFLVHPISKYDDEKSSLTFLQMPSENDLQ